MSKGARKEETEKAIGNAQGGRKLSRLWTSLIRDMTARPCKKPKKFKLGP